MLAFTAVSLALASLRHYWRTSLAVALGVAAATAVITGALLVGDSMRGSLASLALDRLERIDDVLVTDRFFSPDLASRLAADPRVQASFTDVVPGLLIQATLEKLDERSATPERPSARRLGHVTLIGCDARFWHLARSLANMPDSIGPDELVVNRQLADALQVSEGDELVVRAGQSSQIPADSPLGRKTETLRSRRLKVAQIVANTGLGRFSLRPTQRAARNAFVATETLQSLLEQPGRCNALFVAGQRGDTPPSEADDHALQAALRPTLEDLGLRLESSSGYWRLSTERMMLDDAVTRAALRAFADSRPQVVLTYLANWITVLDPADATARGGAPSGAMHAARIPYSTVTAIDLSTTAPLGPFVDAQGQAFQALADDEILINQWAADDYKQQGRAVAPGDRIELTYFLPESTHGQIQETTATFRLRGVVQLDGPAADRGFTPELKGVTDQTSIARWDPPFPFDAERVRSSPPNNQDDLYWKAYRATPKAFVSLSAGQKLWGSRFGHATSVRFVPPADATREQLAAALQISPSDVGLEFLPVKRLGLSAARGTTPFNLLFLGFSLVLMVAAMLLMAILYRLGLEQRASDLGLLSALGWTWPQIRRLQLSEGLAIAAIGGGMGLALGAGYAWAMLAALESPWFWRGAINGAFLKLYVTPASLAIGLLSGAIVALLVMWQSIGRMQRTSARELLSGVAVSEPLAAGGVRARPLVPVALAVAALLVGGSAVRLGGEAQAGAFFGSGALTLAALLVYVRGELRSGGASLAQPGVHPLLLLAARSAQRNPTRSTLTIGLVAAACFLIVAISAFRLDPLATGSGRTSGTGGLGLYGESDQPIYQDLGTAAARAELGFGDREQRELAEAKIYNLRMASGDDASCLNLYQASQPRVLGLPHSFLERGGFSWAGSLAESPAERANPWLLLETASPGRAPSAAVPNVDQGLSTPSQAPTGDAGPRPGTSATAIPVVLDLNTALYSLHLGDATSSPLGKQFSIRDGSGGQLLLRVVGLLKNSIFQGELLVSETAFLSSFPRTSGYRTFLVEAPEERLASVRATLDRVLGDYGFEAESTAGRLADFMQVQNTYLSTFQSLGALGLLLGTFGLSAVQMRSVFERRGELALMRAAGFSRGFLALQVLLENAVLLLLGMSLGLAAAVVAVAPHFLAGGAAVPLVQLAAMLGAIAIVGLAAGVLAVSAVLRAELLPALRGS